MWGETENGTKSNNEGEPAMKCAANLLIIVAIGFLLTSCEVAVGEREDGSPVVKAQNILESTGVSGGLVVHVGCGDGRLTAALGASENYVVHGLDTAPSAVETARARIQSLGIYGDVSVDRWSGERLPYADNLVNLLVLDRAGAVDRGEIMRVLAPGGKAVFLEGQEGKSPPEKL